MERAMKRNEFVLVFIGREGLSDLARELYGSLIGFGAAIAYEGAGCAGEATGRVRELDKLLREEAGMGVVVEVGSMHELLGLNIDQLVPECIAIPSVVPVPRLLAQRLGRSDPVR